MSEAVLYICDVCGREERAPRRNALPDGWRSSTGHEWENTLHFCSPRCEARYWQAHRQYRDAREAYGDRLKEAERAAQEAADAHLAAWRVANPAPVFRVAPTEDAPQ